MTVKELKKEFFRFSAQTPQELIQEYLESAYRKGGMPAAIELLFRWEMGSGYLTAKKLRSKKVFRYKDRETGITFRAQINYARSGYVPKDAGDQAGERPHCKICFDNIGIPGKENLRVFSFDLDGRKFFIQFTPFPLFQRHCVIISREVAPMGMDKRSVSDLASFLDMAKGYTGCSNSDVEWAGSSILEHHHYQAVRNLKLPVMEARPIPAYTLESGTGDGIALLDYPLACCRAKSRDKETLAHISGHIIAEWKSAAPGKNTCNLVVKKRKGAYESYILFRNPGHRTPDELKKVKTEGVGVIEAAGEGIYPVPQGGNADEVWRLIKKKGLGVIKGIISGNNPVKKEDFRELFRIIRRSLLS